MPRLLGEGGFLLSVCMKVHLWEWIRLLSKDIENISVTHDSRFPSSEIQGKRLEMNFHVATSCQRESQGLKKQWKHAFCDFVVVVVI